MHDEDPTRERSRDAIDQSLDDDGNTKCRLPDGVKTQSSYFGEDINADDTPTPDLYPSGQLSFALLTYS